MTLKKSIVFFILIFQGNFLHAQPSEGIIASDQDSLVMTNNYQYKEPDYKEGKFGLRNEDASNSRRFWRSQLLIGGTELAGMGLLMLLPRRITKWDPDYIKKAGRNFRESWTKAPVWDNDDFAMNYIAHPLVGSYYYNAMRSQGSKQWSAFLFSAAQSFIWEYCIEGVAERPSTQDLIITSTTGALIGEAIHRGTLRMGRNGFTVLEKVIISIINPLFVLNNKLNYRIKDHTENSTILSIDKEKAAGKSQLR